VHSPISALVPRTAVLLVAAALRTYRLDEQSLWYDEGVSAFMTTRGPVEIARAAALDIHPPLYYWLLSAWAVPFGSGEIALRGFSVLFGTATVWIVWQLARDLFDDTVAFVASALLAISPLAVQYGQEVRMYALAGFLAAASTWASVRFLGRDGGVRASGLTALAYVAAATALLYAHYYGVLVFAAHQVHFALRLTITRRFRLLAPWVIANAAIVILFLPWLPYALRQTGYYPGLGTPRSPGALAIDAVNVLSIGLATTRFDFRPGLAPFLVLGLIGVATCVVVARRAGDGTGLLPRGALLVWLTLPIAAIIVLSQTRPVYEPRFLMLVLPAWAILVGAGAVASGRAILGFAGGRGSLGPTAQGLLLGLMTAVVLGMLLVPTVRSLGAYYFDPVYARDDYRGLARRIAELERPSDAVILTAPGQAEIFGYYYRGDADLFPLPAQRPIDPEDTRARLEGVADGHQRIWLVRWAAVEADPDDLIAGWLESRARRVGAEQFGRVELRLYDLSASARG
jgi:mannosyltransferase